MSEEKKQLRENPYITYRDPLTGKWIVVKTSDRNVASAG